MPEVRHVRLHDGVLVRLRKVWSPYLAAGRPTQIGWGLLIAHAGRGRVSGQSSAATEMPQFGTKGLPLALVTR